MSSGFVSGGTADAPAERDDEWRRAQAELESARQAKADALAAQNGKSLFEILQENKDKKQAEFEEKARYKLHVSLDDDEADYLREVLERKRKEEEGIRKDESEGLDAFRQQQEEAEKKAIGEESGDGVKDSGGEVWASVGRKRKKGPELGLLKGVKLRKSSSVVDEKETPGTVEKLEAKKLDNKPPENTTSKTIKTPAATSTLKPAQPLSLGLGYASSDEED